MRRVCVRIAAAVGPEHLDCDLRCHRTLSDVLLRNGLLFRDRFAVWSFDRFALIVFLLDLDFHRLDQRRFGVGLEVLNHALRHEEHREHEADRDEQVVGDADEIHPEVAERLRRMARNCADERGGDGDAGRG